VRNRALGSGGRKQALVEGWHLGEGGLEHPKRLGRAACAIPMGMVSGSA
jgi:hypothetical protein